MSLEMVYSKSEILEFNNTFTENISSFFEEGEFIFVDCSLIDVPDVIKIKVYYSYEHDMWYARLHTYNKLQYLFGKYDKLKFNLAKDKKNPLEPKIVFDFPLNFNDKPCEATFVKMGSEVHLMSKIYDLTEEDYYKITNFFECSLFQLEDNYSLLDWGSISGDSFFTNLKYYLNNFIFTIKFNKLNLVYPIGDFKSMDKNKCDVCGSKISSLDSEYLTKLSSKIPNKCLDCLEKIYSLHAVNKIKELKSKDLSYFNPESIKKEWGDDSFDYSLKLLIKYEFIQKITNKFYRLYDVEDIIKDYSIFLDDLNVNNTSKLEKINHNNDLILKFNQLNPNIDIIISVNDNDFDKIIINFEDKNKFWNINYYLNDEVTFNNYFHNSPISKRKIVDYINEFNILSIDFVKKEPQINTENLNENLEGDSSSKRYNSNKVRAYDLEESNLIISVKDENISLINVIYDESLGKWIVRFREDNKFVVKEWVGPKNVISGILNYLNRFDIENISFIEPEIPEIMDDNCILDDFVEEESENNDDYVEIDEQSSVEESENNDDYVEIDEQSSVEESGDSNVSKENNIKCLTLVPQNLNDEDKLIISVNNEDFDTISVKFVKGLVDKWYLVYEKEGKFYKEGSFLGVDECKNELLDFLNSFTITSIGFNDSNSPLKNSLNSRNSDVLVSNSSEESVIEDNEVILDVSDENKKIYPSLPGICFNSEDSTWSFITSTNSKNIKKHGSFNSEEEAFQERIEYLASKRKYGLNPKDKVSSPPIIKSNGKYSIFKGISFDVEECKWTAEFNSNFLGFFDSEMNARRFREEFKESIPIPPKNKKNQFSDCFRVGFDKVNRIWTVKDDNGKEVLRTYSEKEACECSKKLFPSRFSNDKTKNRIKNQLDNIIESDEKTANKKVFCSESNVFLKGIISDSEYKEICELLVGPNLNKVISNKIEGDSLLFDVLFDLTYSKEESSEIFKKLIKLGWAIID